MTITTLPSTLFISGSALAVWNEISRPLINQAGKLGDIPLVVLGVSEQPNLVGEKLTELQTELATLSTNSIYHVVAGATHENLVSKSENAKIVSDYILRVVEAVRTGKRLADL